MKDLIREGKVYAQGGYEAAFRTYEIDQRAHTDARIRLFGQAARGEVV